MRCHDPHAHGTYAVAVSGMGRASPPSTACEGEPAPDRDPGAGARGRPVVPVAPCPVAWPQGPLPAFPASGRGEFERPADLPEAVSVGLLHVVPSCRFVPLHPVLPAAGLAGVAGPQFAHIPRAGARARPRAFRGGANRAPDCPDAPAREPDAGRTLPIGRIRSFFRASANGEAKRPRARRFPPSATHNSTNGYMSIH